MSEEFTIITMIITARVYLVFRPLRILEGEVIDYLFAVTLID